MSEGEEFDFVCPECAEVISVNASMRDALIANGCVICGADVSSEAFSGSDGEGPPSRTP